MTAPNWFQSVERPHEFFEQAHVITCQYTLLNDPTQHRPRIANSEKSCTNRKFFPKLPVTKAELLQQQQQPVIVELAIVL